MIIRFLFMIILFASLNLHSNFSPLNKRFFRFTANEINNLLPELHNRYPDFHDRLNALAQIRLGTPFQFKAVGDGAGFESDPFFRVDITNCTVFVLTNMALVTYFYRGIYDTKLFYLKLKTLFKLYRIIMNNNNDLRQS